MVKHNLSHKIQKTNGFSRWTALRGVTAKELQKSSLMLDVCP
jgi:hypothetical protein